MELVDASLLEAAFVVEDERLVDEAKDFRTFGRAATLSVRSRLFPTLALGLETLPKIWCENVSFGV